MKASKDIVHEEKALQNFKQWLKARGAEILPTTNMYEILRFRALGVKNVIYTNDKGEVSGFVNHGQEAYEAWKHNKAWKGVARRKKRPSGKKRDQLLMAILERDGDECFYCGQVMKPEDMTIEHLVPIAHKGSNHMSNLALAHKKCNSEVDHMCLRDKILHREKTMKIWADYHMDTDND